MSAFNRWFCATCDRWIGLGPRSGPEQHCKTDRRHLAEDARLEERQKELAALVASAEAKP